MFPCKILSSGWSKSGQNVSSMGTMLPCSFPYAAHTTTRRRRLHVSLRWRSWLSVRASLSSSRGRIARSRIFSSSPPRHLLCALAGRLLCTPHASRAAARHPPACAHAAPTSLAHATRCSPCLPVLSHGRRGHGPSSPPPPATAATRHSRRRAELAMEPLPPASFLPKRPPSRVPYLPRKLIDQAAPSLTRRSAAAAAT